MNAARILWRRDVRSGLLSPAYYLVGAAFHLVAGFAFWVFAVTMQGKGLLTTEITFGGMIFWMAVLAVVASLACRLMGEEQERGTLELLLTAPVREAEVVAAKFAAGLYLGVLVTAPATTYPWMLRLIVPGWTGISLAAWIPGVLLLALVVALVTALGLFFSLVFRRPAAALVATFLAAALVIFRGALRSWIGGEAVDGSTGLMEVASHVSVFAAGMIDGRALVFYLSVVGALLFASVRLLEFGRYRRPAGALNLGLSLALVAVLGVMINLVAFARPIRIDLGARSGDAIPAGTRRVLEAVRIPVKAILLAPVSDPLSREARHLLERFQAIQPQVTVERVDPETDLARARQLARQFQIREAGVVILEGKGREKRVFLKALDTAQRGRKKSGLRGATFVSALGVELTAAIQAVSREALPVVYFLTGHGERDPRRFDDFSGYSHIAAAISGRQAEVRTLTLDAATGVPADCAVLVVAGPARPLAASEVSRIREYLGGGGRLMALLDSGAESGLEGLCAEWGLRLGNDRVMETPAAALLPDDRERSGAAGLGHVAITQYGDHPLTLSLHSMVCTLVLPRSVTAIQTATPARSLNDLADRPLATILAWSGATSWAETDGRQSPAQFNEGYDSRGPIPVAACVEKGMGSPIAMDLRPVRVVVIGDSQFAANRCLAGGNEGLFLNALEWLLDRGTTGDADGTLPGVYALNIEGSDRLPTFVLVVIVFPLAGAAMALLVAVTRRDRRALPPATRKG
jgi:ABC-2 type transport system permease protein